MKRTVFSHKAATSFLAIALALSAFGCGDDDRKPTARVYTGEVVGTDVRVGIIASEHRARVFFCGGDESYETTTGWLNAEIDDAHKFGIPADAGQTWILSGNVADAEINGTIDMGNAMPLPFRATAVSDRTISGLYEGSAGCGRLGLIVLQPTPDSTAIGQGACVGGGLLQQVDPLEPLTRAPDGAIRVTVEGSTKEYEVRAAAPPIE
jgi:hypothetical protein